MRLREGCSCYISLGKKEGIESFHIITEKGDCLLVNCDWKKTRNPIPSHSLKAEERRFILLFINGKRDISHAFEQEPLPFFAM